MSAQGFSYLREPCVLRIAAIPNRLGSFVSPVSIMHFRYHSLEGNPHMRIDFRGNLTGPYLVLDRIRPEQNERRFYAMSVTTDLFGNILLLRNWGRIGTAGRVRFDLCSGTTEAKTAFDELARTKHRRGYKNRNHLSAVM